MPYSILRLSLRSPQSSKGFTLVEMIMVIVITGIIGGMVAVFIKMPVQQYMDVARRAEMTDIADTALRRISRDIRTALPNSVRMAGVCDGVGSCFIEFLPVKGSGRYRASAAPSGASAGCGSLAADVLDIATAADICFEVLGPMPPNIVAGGASPDQIVVYNVGITGADAYAGNTLATHNRRAVSAVGTHIINITSANALPFDSPGNRFQVINTPVTYVCAPVAGGVGGTLTRYWGYAIQPGQPTAPATLTSVNPGALLASKVSTCSFSYGAVGQRLALVTMNLGITDSGETVTLYNATHVSNVP